jgi:hypothetical protein
MTAQAAFKVEEFDQAEIGTVLCASQLRRDEGRVFSVKPQNPPVEQRRVAIHCEKVPHDRACPA